MGLNDVASGERLHIGFFGTRNAGKSSIVNAVCGQPLSIVHDTPGTTTDLVSKAMELLPLGPVQIVDTPGFDDEGDLGTQRVKRAQAALATCDVAVLVIDATRGKTACDLQLEKTIVANGTPCVEVWNKSDLLGDAAATGDAAAGDAAAAGDVVAGDVAAAGAVAGDAAAAGDAAEPRVLRVRTSALEGVGIEELKEAIAKAGARKEATRAIVADLVSEGDILVLVIPIDESAPKGRIIMPQQMVIRDALDAHATCFSCQPQQLQGVLDSLRQPPRMVITDSQAFKQVSEIVPDDVPLTSFSILMARYKGDLQILSTGAAALDNLADGSRILVVEGCTHHRQCNDIGTVKIPRLVRAHSGVEPIFEFCSGHSFPESVSAYDLVIHCGACMLSEGEMAARLRQVASEGVPIVNYGVAIAHMNGITTCRLMA